MSLPPGFLEELRDRASLSQVVGRKVTWEQKKTNISKGDFWAPCPFHSEKTASFHVDDRKGFYYCFGCHEKGDSISFIRNTENVSFIEAVEILAREAGMTMPARDPKAQEKIDANKELADIMEQAVQFYKMQFSSTNAQVAREYIKVRGLSQETISIFEIGFASNDRVSLSKNFLTIGYEGSNGWEMNDFRSDFTGVDNGINFDDVTFPVKSYDEGEFVINPATGQPVRPADYQATFGTPYPPYNKMRAGFNRKENKYVSNLKNNSMPRPGEIVYAQSLSGVKGMFATVVFSIDSTTNITGKKELFAVSSTYVESSY